ncbi:hypothetical protein SLS56_002932 [Neofusicoccum ribis]|uniref:Uncharacterized protein n=1 Tax=Neofusicoccum ribis TaxID=45134 RepID=A0ABR3T152_9PEZI
MDAFTPQQTIELKSRIGCKKAHMRIDKLFVNSLMTGPLLGFGYFYRSYTHSRHQTNATKVQTDHVVANMFFIPLGIWCGAPFGAGYYIWKSMIPTALGNIVGGVLFVGTAYWYLYLTGEIGVNVRFDIGSLSTAEEVGGPMRNGKKLERDANGNFMNGVDPDSQTRVIERDQLPHSSSPLRSGLSAELGDDTPYTKSHAERTAIKKSEGSEKV